MAKWSITRALETVQEVLSRYHNSMHAHPPMFDTVQEVLYRHPRKRKTNNLIPQIKRFKIDMLIFRVVMNIMRDLGHISP